MSLPPEVLRIKRKRTDEPIDSLYIEADGKSGGTKRQTQLKDYVFRRQAKEDSYATNAPSVPKILATQPGDEKAVLSSSQGEQHPQKEQGIGGEAAQAGRAPRRQFHLSRPSIASTTGKRKLQQEQDDDVAVIMEGPVRRQKLYHPISIAKEAPRAEVRVLKRPGVGARLQPAGKGSQRQASRTVNLQLENAMHMFASEAEDYGYAATAGAQQLETKANTSSTIEDTSMEDGDEAEYVYDTFVRHTAKPAPQYEQVTAAEPERIGYLIIDQEDQELWETFAEDEEDSEKDWDSEQDDENAENYYGADYPEEELELEDEYDGDAYRYRRGGASDEEEFDEDDAWSDDDFDSYGKKGRVLNRQSDSLRTPEDIADVEELI